MNKLGKTTTEVLETPYIDNPFMNDAILLAQKGVFIFDAVTDNSLHYGDYTKIASPKAPIRFTDLPDEIRSILQGHKISVDTTKEKYICVKHAYEKD